MMRLVHIVPLLVLTLFVNCSTRVVPVERVKIDSIFIAQYHRDTVYKSDSVIIRAVNDTIYKDAWRYIYRDRMVHDTVTIIKVQRDSVTRYVKVEKELTRLQNVKLALGKVFLWVLIAGAAVILMWFMRRLKGW